jgi:hypothetical protein
VGLVLLNFANRSGFTSVGIDRLAKELGRHRRNVERGLEQLAAAGYLDRKPRGGVPGLGGTTAGTALKVPAAKVPAAAEKVPATASESTGDGRRKVPATGAGETLLTHITPAANASGLEARSATAKNDDTGSATATGGAARSSTSTTAGPGGEILRMLEDLTASPRSEPRPVRDAVLSALRSKFGLPAKRPVSDNENSAPADVCCGSGSRTL